MRFPLVFCLFAIACSTSSEEKPDEADSGASSSSSSSGSSGSSGSSDSEADAAPSDAPRWQWQETESPAKRDHHVTFAVESDGAKYLYVAGGKQGNTALTTVERARVLDGGTLERWNEVGELPVLMGPTIAQHGQDIVLVGGVRMEDGARVTATATDVVRVQPDGSLIATAGPALHVPRFHATTAVVGDFVFVLGGFPDNTVFEATDSIERARWQGGALSAFEEVSPLPEPLTHHASVAYGQGIYLISGVTDSGPTANVWYARVDEAGALSEWTVVGELPAARGTHAASVVRDKLVVAGGMDDPDDMGEVPEVLAATVHEDGTLDAFEVVATMEVPRMHVHQAPLVGSSLYLVGGAAHDHASGKMGSVARADILHVW